MKTLCSGFCLAAAITFVGGAQATGPQGPASAGQDKEAVRQAAYDYAEGFYEGTPDRMERGVHPAIIKRGLVARPGAPALLMPMNAETLVEMTRAGGAKQTPSDKRNIAFELLDIRDNIASARIFTAQFNDYLHLVKQEGRWRIAHVLWQPPAPAGVSNAEADKSAVGQVMKDFFQAIAAADPARLERLTHPEAALRMFRKAPASDRSILTEGNRDLFVAAVLGKQLPPLQSPTVAMVDSYDSIASVAVTTPALTSYWHLAKQNGQWRVVNALFR